MTPEQLQQQMEEIQAKEKAIREDRGRRYGSDEDTLANVAEFGSDGAIVSFWECVMRFKKIYRFIKKAKYIKDMFGQVKDIDDLENAVMDARNYLAYILILERRIHKPEEKWAGEVKKWEDLK